MTLLFGIHLVQQWCVGHVLRLRRTGISRGWSRESTVNTPARDCWSCLGAFALPGRPTVSRSYGRSVSIVHHVFTVPSLLSLQADGTGERRLGL